MYPPYFDYSPIIRRPRLEPPDGKRLAVWFGVAIEHFVYGQPSISIHQFTENFVPDPLNYGWRDYGNRVGVWRLTELLERYGIPVTAITNSAVFDNYPPIAEEGRARGWTWVAHGETNSRLHVGLDRDAEKGFLERIVAKFESSVGVRPKGWVGPALTSTPNTLELLAELGFDYTLDWNNDDQPYPFKTETGRIVAIPQSSEVTDMDAFIVHHQTGEEFAQSVINQFDCLYTEAENTLRVMGIPLHTFVVGQPFRARPFERSLEYIASHEDIWLTTPDEIAAWYLKETA